MSKYTQDLTIRLLASLPRKHKDKHQQVLYELGYLIGVISNIAEQDSLIQTAILHEYKKHLPEYK